MNFNLLKEIVATPAAPGFEHQLRDLVKDHLKGYADSIETDSIGNLIVRKGKGDTKVMAAAHLDEISLIATYVDDNGFIRFHTLGGFDPRTLYTQRVSVQASTPLPGVIGCKPAHLLKEEEKSKAPKIEELFIDVGLPADEVKELVKPGTLIIRDRELIEMGDNVTGKSLDNRASVYILVEAIKKAKDLNIDFYGVFTVQEEVGLRGARVAASSIKPDVGINLDITLANDFPGVEPQQRITDLGKGTAIKVMDGSVICTGSLVEFMEKTAKDNDISFQREVLTAGGTDTSAMQYLTGVGARVSCISTPTRYVHSTVETASKRDIDSGIDLLTILLKELH
ncbi:MAG: M42 family metallopeptidase, partial [Balneolales bacterium]